MGRAITQAFARGHIEPITDLKQSLLPPGPGLHVGGDMELAARQRLCIVKPVPLDLAVDGRTLPLQALCMRAISRRSARLRWV
ncbi:hypothetical protein DC522_28505 [Microvirga sp. KLBC 81]|nr:hypothetical protein DC522_28505 [Microvirga sp. KLBC 81]